MNSHSANPFARAARRLLSQMRTARSLSQAPVGDKREAILRAATKVFARSGYFNAKVADVAKVAGVADGTVYLYFKSKEEILRSIFDRGVERVIAEARAEIAGLRDARESGGERPVGRAPRGGAHRVPLLPPLQARPVGRSGHGNLLRRCQQPMTT